MFTHYAKLNIMKSRYAVCVESKDCEDLERGKVYAVLSDAKAKKEGFLRIVDESGDDYLYPESYFVFIDLPRKAKVALSMET